jgi:hypothetical protein
MPDAPKPQPLLTEGSLNIAGHKIPFALVAVVVGIAGLILVWRARSSSSGSAVTVGAQPASSVTPYATTASTGNPSDAALANIQGQLGLLTSQLNGLPIGVPGSSASPGSPAPAPAPIVSAPPVVAPSSPIGTGAASPAPAPPAPPPLDIWGTIRSAGSLNSLPGIGPTIAAWDTSHPQGIPILSAPGGSTLGYVPFGQSVDLGQTPTAVQGAGAYPGQSNQFIRYGGGVINASDFSRPPIAQLH